MVYIQPNALSWHMGGWISSHVFSLLPYVPTEWLVEKRKLKVVDKKFYKHKDVKGYYERWQSLIGLLDEQNELWLYRSPIESWK